MKNQILQLRSQGKSYPEIIKELGCSKSTVAYHCGNGQKEKSRLRSLRNRKSKCSCGKDKVKSADRCRLCDFVEKRAVILNSPLSKYIIPTKNTTRYNKVRRIARLIMEASGIKKECKKCKFDIVVEVCHIKGISTFAIDICIKEVNSLDNLAYLCPNHHAMYDKGLITL